MADREKVIKGFECCHVMVHDLGPDKSSCDICPYKDVQTEEQIDLGGIECVAVLHDDALELLKEQEKELTRDDLDTLVDMIAIKAKSDGRFFSPYEVGLALVAHGQHDERFRWGEVIKYSPSEVVQILNEVMQDARP